MTQSTRRAQVLGLTVLVAGVVASTIYFSNDDADQREAESDRRVPATRSIDESSYPATTNRLAESESATPIESAAMRTQIAELRTKLEAMERLTGPSAKEEGPALDVAQVKAANESQHTELIESVSAQAVDSSWGPATQAKVAAEYQNAALSTGGGAMGRVQHVDCRSNGCVVSIEWPSHEAASKNWSAALSAKMSVNCNREILIEDTVSAGPYVGRMILTDCDK